MAVSSINVPSTPSWTTQQAKAFLSLADGLSSSLVSIIGCATVLRNSPDHWGQHELNNFLDTIVGNAEHSVRLLENAKDLLGGEQNNPDLECQPTDPRRLIHHVLQPLTEKVTGFNFDVNIPDGLPLVEIDVIRISRALNILLQNILNLAVDHGIEITAQATDDNSKVQINICYRGWNVLPQNESNTEPDSYHPAEKPVYDLHLEMYVVHHILSAHKGTLWADSLPGQATEVHIVLPTNRRAVPQQTARSASRTQNKPTAKPSLASPVGKILIVEADQRLAHMLKTQLERVGHTVICTAETKYASEIAMIVVPELVLLGLPVTDDSGCMDTCKELREFTSVPIIVIANSFNEDDLVRSLESGADDYVSKPLQVNELIARIQAQLRRSYLPDTPGKSRNTTVFKTGELTIDFAYRQVTVRGEPIELTPVEYKLLYNLAANAGRILTHGQLISKIWGPMFNQENQYLWVNISRLRAKIEDDPGDPQYVVTKRGVGYSLAVLEQPSDNA